MYKTFIEPYFLYAIEVWGHTVTSSNDILNKLFLKLLRIIFSCYRSDDALRHNNDRIKSIEFLYNKVIERICTKHHSVRLPKYVTNNIMPTLKLDSDNVITNYTLETRSSKSTKYDYANVRNNINNSFKVSCIHVWNGLPLSKKELLYNSNSLTFDKSVPN